MPAAAAGGPLPVAGPLVLTPRPPLVRGCEKKRMVVGGMVCGSRSPFQRALKTGGYSSPIARVYRERVVGGRVPRGDAPHKINFFA